MKRWILFLAIFFAMIGTTNAAMVTLDFEDLGEQYWYLGGNQNISDFYPGLYFGPDVTVSETSKHGFNHLVYPPHSGNQVVHSHGTDFIEVSFSKPVSDVGAWFTFAVDPGVMEGYDSSGKLVGSASLAVNYPKASDFMGIHSSNYDIASVIIYGKTNYWTMDDFSYNEIPLPGTIWLLSAGLIGFLGKKRLRKSR